MRLHRPGAHLPWPCCWRLAGAWLLLVLCTGCSMMPWAKDSDDAAAKPAGAAASAPATVSVIRLTVDAPSNVRPLLERYLDLARLQEISRDADIDNSEWVRLIAAAPAQARELLQTEGYFDAEVSVKRDPVDPSRVTVTVLPGPRTQVGSLRVETEGEVSRRADLGLGDAQELQAGLPSAAVLQPGKPFRNADWSSSKSQVLTRLRSAGYALASLSGSAADVDATARSARLFMVVDSGPLFKSGPLLVTGLNFHDEATVRALAGFGPGTPLSEVLLLDYQERLQKVGLFESVLVSFEPDAAKPDNTEVSVRLKELPLQQATVGLGISANTGPRGTLEHTHRRPFGYAVTATNKLEWGRDQQSWQGDLLTHPKDGFYRNLLGVQIERVKSDTDAVLSQRLRLGRTQDTPRIDRLVFAELLRSRKSDVTGVSTAEALSANLHLVWRDLDSVLLPTKGLVASLQTGAGLSRSDTGNGPFARLYGRVTGYLPLGKTWYGQARIELGQVIKRDGTGVPDALGFRAGGDDSVRGYAYRSLAPLDSAGAVVSGNMLLTTSIELARPIMPSLPEVWGAVFVDAGRAVNEWSSFKPAVGVGVGVRYRSPIGPLRADLAWGHEVQKLRLHLSVGVAF